jgi:hypothetical protein
MISAQSTVFLLVPNEANERVLHPGTVLRVQGSDLLVIGFAQSVAPSVGSDVNLFFDQQGKFFQQSGTIVAANESLDQTASPLPAEAPSTAQSIGFRCVGSPVSAENRGSYRVSVTALEMTARIEKERDCLVVDVSPEGLGIITRQNYRLGTAVKLLLEYEGEHLEGLVRVQTTRLLPDGQCRCGLRVASTESAMRKTLQKLTALVQRRQLRNYRRTA